jgi:hypothetical protein
MFEMEDKEQERGGGACVVEGQVKGNIGHRSAQVG